MLVILCPTLPPASSASGPHGRAAVAGHARVQGGFLSRVVYCPSAQRPAVRPLDFQAPGAHVESLLA